MELDFTAEQDDLRASVRSVLAKECPISLVRAQVETGDREGAMRLWSTMVRLDWPALTMPESVGGLGLGFVELGVVAEEVGRALAPGPLVPTTAAFAAVVREAGSLEQQDRFLGAVAAGGLTGTLAAAEDGMRRVPPTVDTTAVVDGDTWVLRGVKRHVVEAADVDEIAVAARVPGTSNDDGIVLAVVPREAVRVDPSTTIDLTRRTATVRLDNVAVADDRVLVGGSAIALTRALEEATVAMALDAVGNCQAIFDITLAYARTREQFGVPIGSFQAVKHKLANMYVALERARATCYFAAATIAEDDDRRTMAASMAKAAAGDCQRLVAQDGIQLLGGIGYTWEHDMHIYVKRAKASDGLFGSASAHRARVADLLGL